MTPDSLWKLVHVASNAIYMGGLLAMLMVQSLLQRSTDDGERKALARAIARIGRVGIGPATIVSLVSGLGFLFSRYGGMSGAPPYVHVMLGLGVISIGLAHAWSAQARRLSAALDAGQPFPEAKRFLDKGWVFGLAASSVVMLTMCAALLQLPNPVRRDAKPLIEGPVPAGHP